MGLQIRTYVDGNQEFIDLYGNENIDMEVSFAEIQDITKKNSAFTREFKVPGTNNNNYIFNYFFDINSVYLDWNPKKKFEADLMYNGYELYNGYIRMNSVSINKTEKIYSITFYSAIGDLVSNIGDKGLCEVDTTEINYYLSALTSNTFWLDDPDFQPIDVPVDWSGGTSWYGYTSNQSLLNGDVQLMLAQRGYDYTGNTFGDIRDIDVRNTPILYFSGGAGFFDYYDVVSPNEYAVNLAYLIPSVRIGKLYEMICDQAGYTIESNFFETSYFGRHYLPLSFNTDSVYLNQSKDYRYRYFNFSGTSNASSGQSWETRSITFGTSPPANFQMVFPIIQQEDNLGYNPYPPAAQIAYQNYLFFRLPVGEYIFSVSANTVWLGTGTLNPTPVPITNAYIGVLTFADTVDILADQVSTFVLNANQALTNLIYQNTFTSSTYSSEGYYGDYDYYFLAIDPNPIAPYSPTDFTNYGITLEVRGQSSNLPTYIELYKEMSCEYKQIDYITDINRMFNLVVVEHPVKPKTLIVEPMIDYIGKGDVLDWTTKVDWDSSINLTPTSSIINGSLFFSNKMDKDYVNTQYNTKSNLIYGQNIFNLGEDFKNQQTNMSQKLLGQNTDYYLNASGSTNIALSSYFISKQENINGQAVFEYRPFRSLPRVAYKGVPLNNQQLGQNAWKVRLGSLAFPVGYYQNYNRFTTYPFGITGFSNYEIYDSSIFFTPDEIVYPEAPNMYDVFYRDYIEDLISPENKIMTCKMYLTPWEVSNLYFDEKIMIKNAYWRINKITNLSLLEPGVCNVELVKLTRDYEPFPIRYYDLICCECGTQDIIHTHTDLVYHIYAFNNQYVSVVLPPYTISYNPTVGDYTFDNIKTFKVIETTYNPNYTYTTPYFNAGVIGQNTPNHGLYNYFVLTGCSQNWWEVSSGNTLKLYNDYEEPSNLRERGGCTDVYVFNTGYSQTTVYWTYCDGTDGSWVLDPGSGITLCSVYSTIQGDNISVCADVLIDCDLFTPFPTPTPSNTPGLSPTPTPSITPTNQTPTPTQTPSSTPGGSCEINTVINITDTGYLKYDLCDGTQQYEFFSSTGNHTITECIIPGTIRQGVPYSDVAAFTLVSNGTGC